jgi:predicted RNA methylase
VLLIFIGIVVKEDVVFVVGAGAGAVSLIAALVWRSDLVSTWRRDHPRT